MQACAPNERPTDTEPTHNRSKHTKPLNIVGCQNAGPTASSSVYIYICISPFSFLIITNLSLIITIVSIGNIMNAISTMLIYY